MLKQNFISGLVKLIEYWVSAVNVVLFIPCVEPLSRIKISFPLSSICTDELISTPKIMTFLPMLIHKQQKNLPHFLE